jgi:tRNA pseudouridine55 synthase
LSINGILNINKPAGKTSLSVVTLIRRYSRQRHVGHAGTLDPLAAGVLPICLGQASRISSYILAEHKTYLACIELGIATDTYDAEGKIIQQTDPSNITSEQIEEVLPQFQGTIMQKPPIYSALKHQGKRLYQLARAGIEVEPKERRVEVFHLEFLQWQPPYFTIEVECGKGTYIRSLAHDIGQRLGCGAYLESLVRTACGPFNIKDSVTLTQLDDAFRNNYWQDLLYPIDTVLERYPASTVDLEQERAIRNGRTIALSDMNAEGLCRVYSLDGRFVALLRSLPESGVWQPQMVFNDFL